MFGGQQQRQEGIVVDLAGPAGVVTLLLEFDGQVRYAGEVGEDAAVDLEAAAPRSSLIGARSTSKLGSVNTPQTLQ